MSSPKIYDTAKLITRKWQLEIDVKEILNLIAPTDPESKLKPGQNPSFWGPPGWALWHSSLYLLSHAKTKIHYDPKLGYEFVLLVQALLTCKKCRNSFQFFLTENKISEQSVNTPEKLDRLFNDAHNFVNRKHNIASVDRIAQLKIKSIDDLPIPKGMPPRELLDLPQDIYHARLTKRIVPFADHEKLMKEEAANMWIDALFTLLYFWFAHYPDAFLKDKLIQSIRKKYKQFIIVFATMFRPICPEFMDLFKETFGPQKQIWRNSLYLLITLNGLEKIWKRDLARESGCDTIHLEKWQPLKERLEYVRLSMKEGLEKLTKI